MIRVTKAQGRSRTVLTVDGDISGDSIAIVENCCIEAETDAKPVQLFLRHITTVDEAGVNLLRRMAAKGVCVLASDVYTSYLVQTVVSPEPAPQSFFMSVKTMAGNAGRERP